MNSKEFEAHMRQNSEYETIYNDSEGRRIVVIKLIDMYFLCVELSKVKIRELSDVELSFLAEKYTGADGLDVVDYGRAVMKAYRERLDEPKP